MYSLLAEGIIIFVAVAKVPVNSFTDKLAKVNPEVVFRDFAVLYLSKDQIEKKIETYQNKIQDEANEFINKLNIYNEEINKKILDIREKYDVS